MATLSSFISKYVSNPLAGGGGFSAAITPRSTPIIKDPRGVFTDSIFGGSQPVQNFSNDPRIQGGASTQNLININRSLEKENSLSKTGLFNNQQELSLGFTNFASQVKDAFQTIGQQNIQTVSKNDNVTKGTVDNPEKENPSITDTAKQGFSEILAQIGPGGLVAGILIVGVILLKK